MEEETSIRSLFSSAKSIRQQLESAPDPTASSYQENLQKAINKLEECRNLIERLSLFSSNETLEDVSSGDIQYLLADYYLADLTMKDGVSDRKGVLRRAQKAFERYLHNLDNYDILSKDNKKLHERFLDNRDDFSLIPGNNAAARRDTKIARFKQEKELKMKLEYLIRVPHALQGDDTAVRELYLAEIELNIHNTFHALDMIGQELKILALMPVPPTPSPEQEKKLAYDHRDRDHDRNGQSNPSDTYSDRLDPPTSHLLAQGKAGPILDPQGKPLQPFTLLGGSQDRQALQAGVFRPDHNLPTMTIDEYLDEERRRGGIVDGGGAGGSGQGQAQVIDEDDMNKADQETMKAREWDEFVEANPKGSGNTINRG